MTFANVAMTGRNLPMVTPTYLSNPLTNSQVC